MSNTFHFVPLMNANRSCWTDHDRHAVSCKKKARRNIIMKKPCLILEAVLLLAAVFTGCTAKRTMENHQGIDVASPDWVAKLSAAADAKRLPPFCSARRFPSFGTAPPQKASAHARMRPSFGKQCMGNSRAVKQSPKRKLASGF